MILRVVLAGHQFVTVPLYAISSRGVSKTKDWQKRSGDGENTNPNPRRRRIWGGERERYGAFVSTEQVNGDHMTTEKVLVSMLSIAALAPEHMQAS